MNLQLDDVALFVRVANLGTLSAAARERDVPVSQVSRAVDRLEAVCGVALLRRSTHGLSLTDEGDAFLAQSRRMLDIQSELQADLSGRLGAPGGWVRVSVSAVLAQTLIAPSLPSLQATWPALRLDIAADDRLIDMVRDGIDVAIRTGAPASDSVVARPIGTLRRGLYASPGYLARCGMPKDLDDLARHRLVTSSASPALNDWTFQRDGREQVWTARGDTRVDSSAALVALVQAGAGISRLTDLVATPLVRAGALVPVLPDLFSSAPTPVHAVMLRERHRLPKVRACVDHWAAWLAAHGGASPLA
ncbi:LysR family transcriptional regulator [Leptothrix discophora]|uniref:LysR family transcriptional regulator n=1 Tax=Leptothrix discophora TaxID=89 RepID=A0ABT9FZL2_LEPDI|nr:LysR family transcriptional regulator [Leptothrix discophora]MDP4299388.1 LysR family transcriptional regulator [Leptothrix discophora]